MEAEWIESTLTRVLDKHATQIRFTALSKRWWTQELETKSMEYVQTVRPYQQGKVNTFTVKTE